MDSLSQEDIKKLILSESKSLGDISLSDLQRETKLTLLGDAKVMVRGLKISNQARSGEEVVNMEEPRKSVTLPWNVSKMLTER